MVTLASLCIAAGYCFFNLPSSTEEGLQRYCFLQGLYEALLIAVVGATRSLESMRFDRGWDSLDP